LIYRRCRAGFFLFRILNILYNFWFISIDKTNVLEYIDPIISEYMKNADYQKKLRNKSILIVEDDLVSYHLLTEYLSPSQVRIAHAQTGQQAIDMFDSGNYDLVLLDIKLPEVDGFTVARHFKKYKKNIPIIAQTAKVMQSDRDNCFKAGCDEYIAKPIPIKELHDKINRLMN